MLDVTLPAAPVESAPGTVAWLTVDETDNDLRAFWVDVLSALAIGGAVPSGVPH